VKLGFQKKNSFTQINTNTRATTTTMTTTQQEEGIMNNDRIYTAPESNTVIKRAPWYERDGKIGTIPNKNSSSAENKMNRNQPSTEQEEQLRKNTTRFALLPFSPTLLKTNTALKNAFLASIACGLLGAGYRYNKMKRNGALLANNKMLRLSNSLLGYVYASSVSFLGIYLVLRYRELKEKEKIREAIAVLNTKDIIVPPKQSQTHVNSNNNDNH
jgi:hypothetical protein